MVGAFDILISDNDKEANEPNGWCRCGDDKRELIASI